MGTLRLAVGMAVIAILTCVAPSSAARAPATGVEATAQEITVQDSRRRQKKTFNIKMYREMRCGDLTVSIRGGKYLFRASGDHANLIGYQRTSSRPQHRLPVPTELVGQPALRTPFGVASAPMLLSVSKPARCYAYIGWHRSNHRNEEEDQWHLYQRDPHRMAPIFYRDFPAGEHRLRFTDDYFVGLGVNALDALSPRERIMPVGRIVGDRPFLDIRSDHDTAQTASLSYEVVTPATQKAIFADQQELTLKPRSDHRFPIEVRGLDEGVMSFIKMTVTCGEQSWRLTLPYGRFPVPPDDASIAEPIFPYGAYEKLRDDVTHDREIRSHFLAATFCQMRRLGMNVCVLDANDTRRYALDEAAKYKMKCIIRLGNKAGTVAYTPDEIVNHPAVLTYAIGDEPKIGKSLDNHAKLHRELTEKYPRYTPMTSVMLDVWGTGGDVDASLIYNHHLKDYKLVRVGRLYCFRRNFFGLLRSADYKLMPTPTAIFVGLEAETERPWWLVPQFFGQDRPSPYWRVPNGAELKGVVHLALAHRCSGILGFTIHSQLPGFPCVAFDPATMAPSEFAQLEALADLGEAIRTAKPILHKFTPVRLSVFHITPHELDAAARWLTDRRFCIYVANRDTERSHPADLHMYLGPSRDAYAEKLYREIGRIEEVFGGKNVPFEKHVEPDGTQLLRIQLDPIPPGEGRLLNSSIVFRTHASDFSIMGPPSPSHSMLSTPSYPWSRSIPRHLRMLSAFTPSPMAHWLTAMPVCSPRAAAARDSLTSLTWTWVTRSMKRSRNATGSCPAMNVLPVSMFIFR